MDEHKKFLADRLLSEERAINYRLLSRALDVHVNTAKEMLFDFHKYQNELRASSIHATYLIYGIRSSDNPHGDGDVEMSSSMPEQESLSDDVQTTTLSLVREEDLKAVLDDYTDVTSIHVYSLAPHPQKDLSLLSDISTQLAEYPKGEDVAAMAAKFGTILNTQMRRRDRKARAPESVSATSRPVKQEPAKAKPAHTIQIKQDASAKLFPTAKPKHETADASPMDSSPASSAGKKPAPPSKKGGAGGIMQSFAKAAAKPAKPKPAVKKEEDTAMALSDDGEADDADLPGPKKETSDADAEAVRKSRKQREDDLRRMMEEDDEEDDEDDDEDKDEDKDAEEEQADEEMEEAPEPEPVAEPEPKKEDNEPAEVVSSTGDGRRRGKRRVMKKKRIMDDQGYMVTIQEAAWESFSEDEAPPTKKSAPTPAPSSSAPKAKKTAGGKGQGNIMSFFSKK